MTYWHGGAPDLRPGDLIEPRAAMTTTHLAPYADCLVCDWAPDPDARASVDRQAEKHTKDEGHATRSGGRPEVRR